MSYFCRHCHIGFKRQYNRNRHEKEVHAKDNTDIYFYCPFCSEKFDTYNEHSLHVNSEHSDFEDKGFQEQESALKGSVKAWRREFPPSKVNFEDCFDNRFYNDLAYNIRKELIHHPAVKIVLCVRVDIVFASRDEENIERLSPHYLRTPPIYYNNLLESSLLQDLNESILTMHYQMEDRILGQSQGRHVLTPFVDIEIARVAPITGRAMRITDIVNKSSIVFIKNTNDNCFLHAVAAHFVGKKLEYTQNYVEYEDYAKKNFLYDESWLPMEVGNIRLFENANSDKEISINILYAEAKTKGIYPIYITPKKYDREPLNILLYKGEKMEIIIIIFDIFTYF